MWKVAVVCSALLAFSAPALAQTTPPDNTLGIGDLGPGGVALGAAGVGFAVWGIYSLSKKSTTTTSCTSAC